MPSGSAKQTPQPKASEVAAETKRKYLPLIKSQYADQWPTYSFLIPQPLAQLAFTDRPATLAHPTFWIRSGDPVDIALHWKKDKGVPIPLICGANDKRPGGDWETGVQGYEGRLCRRSSLAAALATPGPGGQFQTNFPIPSTGGIYSPCVVVFRGAQYEYLPFECWDQLPVVSIPATRWPKLVPDGSKYSFSDERTMVKDKIRGALRICAYHGHETVVVAGDWGLGNAHRNPPRELAEVWREVLLYDPELRGRIKEVAFVFEDATQCTTQMILNEMSKKDGKGKNSGGDGKGKGKDDGKGKTAAGSATGATGLLSDAAIFQTVFDENEIRRVLEQPDARYGLDNLLTK